MTEPPSAAAYFGDRATFYNDRYDIPDADGHALRARMSVVLGLIGNGPGSVLDAGMGPGRLCVELAQRGWLVSGVDAAEEMVAVARRRLPDAAARLRRAEIEALPYPDETFEAVAATGVLEYADVPRALSELARVLRPGGVAVVSYPNPYALYGIWKSRIWYAGIRSAKRMLRRPGAAFPRGGPTLPPHCFEQLLRSVALPMTRIEYASYLVVPTPLDQAMPRLAMQLGERLEGSRPSLARRLATQVVYAARKPA